MYCTAEGAVSSFLGILYVGNAIPPETRQTNNTIICILRAVKVSKKIRKTDLKKIRESLNYTGMMREWEDWGWFGGTGWLAGWLGLDEWLVGPRNLYTINQCCCTTGELLSEFPESHTATEARNSLKLFWGPGQPRLRSSKHGFTSKFLYLTPIRLNSLILA